MMERSGQLREIHKRHSTCWACSWYITANDTTLWALISIFHMLLMTAKDTHNNEKQQQDQEIIKQQTMHNTGSKEKTQSVGSPLESDEQEHPLIAEEV